MHNTFEKVNVGASYAVFTWLLTKDIVMETARDVTMHGGQPPHAFNSFIVKVLLAKPTNSTIFWCTASRRCRWTIGALAVLVGQHCRLHLFLLRIDFTYTTPVVVVQPKFLSCPCCRENSANTESSEYFSGMEACSFASWVTPLKLCIACETHRTGSLWNVYKKLVHSILVLFF